MNAPKHFDKNAINYFYFLVNELEKIDKLNSSDQPIIERLAFNLSIVEECESILIRDGFVMEGLHGKKEHPAVSIMMKAQSKIIECFKLLGLDAGSKLKEEQVKLPDINEDPVIKILRGI